MRATDQCHLVCVPEGVAFKGLLQAGVPLGASAPVGPSSVVPCDASESQ